METQLKIVTKAEAHEYIDAMQGNEVMILTYNCSNGISDNGRLIKKKRGKKMADKANVIVLVISDPTVITLNLHNSIIEKEKKFKSILLSNCKSPTFI